MTLARLLTIPEAASALGVSASTVRRLIKDGLLAPTRFRGLTRISTEALGSFIACNTVLSGPSSMESNPSSGTSAGQRAGALVVGLHGRPILISQKPSLPSGQQPSTHRQSDPT